MKYSAVLPYMFLRQILCPAGAVSGGLPQIDEMYCSASVTTPVVLLVSRNTIASAESDRRRSKGNTQVSIPTVYEALSGQVKYILVCNRETDM